ncbi:hypothetical protein ACHAWT_002391 [Skeletonema menzelii]
MAFTHHRHHQYRRGHRSTLVVKEGSEDNDDDDDATIRTYPRLLVMFRPPSRHTYGFREGDTYDLPLLELQTLIQDRKHKDIHINFIPVVEKSRPSANDLKPQQEKQSRKQMKKKKLKKNPNEAGTQALYWIECSDNSVDNIISIAVSRAILTHAIFRIDYSASFSNDDWTSVGSNGVQIQNFLESLDVISMSNPNMSNEECSTLLQTVSNLIDSTLYQLHHQLSLSEDGVLIYHHEQSSDICTHHIQIGRRMAIGPAGTTSAPSQTLRRTHRGVLKEYALKNRFGGITAERDTLGKSFEALATTSISTAMEPEIGFLMANLAGSDAGKRVCDPCCGSGSLLLYAAALGATHLTGVDSLNGVWEGAEDEFKRHTSVIGESKRKLAIPTFFHGDILDPRSTECLHAADSFDAIVVDPPYNIGAPVLLAGQDSRPLNYHLDDDDEERGRVDRGETFNNDQRDAIPSILTLARRVLVENGRLVFFLPVRGHEMNMALEEVLVTKGWQISESDEQLQIKFGRLQRFSPTFARWLIVVAKSSVNDI